MQKWEYRVLFLAQDKHGSFVWHDKDTRNLEVRLNAIAQEGWEFVQAVTLSRHAESVWAGTTTTVQYIFKRPVA